MQTFTTFTSKNKIHSSYIRKNYSNAQNVVKKLAQKNLNKIITTRFIYIIGKLLKHKCLKWARMTHSDIWNTSYGQKKGRESNWQFDSWPLKVGNRFDFLACRWRTTYRWKVFRWGLQLWFRPHFNRRFAHKVMGPQSLGSLNFGNFETPIWESWDKIHLDVGFVERHNVYYTGEGVGFPQV
jgi:hypothetical protein